MTMFDPKTLLNVSKEKAAAYAVAGHFQTVLDRQASETANVTTNGSLAALYAAIATGRDAAQDDATGLSVSHSDIDGHRWRVTFGVDDSMTVVCSEISYVFIDSVQIASLIAGCWDSEWNDN